MVFYDCRIFQTETVPKYVLAEIYGLLYSKNNPKREGYKVNAT